MDSRTIIDDLGGVAKVSGLTGASRTAVYNWVKDGIPYRHWPAIRAADPNVTDAMLEASRPVREQASA